MSDSRFRVGATGEFRGSGRRAAGPWRPWVGLAGAIVGLAAPVVSTGARAQPPSPPGQAAPAQPSSPPGQAAPAQPSSPPGQAAPAQPPAPTPESAEPLSHRYKFGEKYGREPDPGRPELLAEYQVGSTETYSVEAEKVRGAPQRTEFTRTTIYTERPANVGRLGEVLDAVRTYDLFRLTGVAPFALRVTPPLQGLTLWYHPRNGYPQADLISMNPERPIREPEFQTILDEVFFPRLAGVLPNKPVRVADTWPISRQAARALVAGIPAAGRFQIDGTLTRIDKAAEEGKLIATIDLAGAIEFDRGAGGLRAQLSFLFVALKAPVDAHARPGRGRGDRDPEIIDAAGYISKFRMVLQKTVSLDENGRLQQIETGQLQLERRQAGQPGGPAIGSLKVPEKDNFPKADEANSWILYDDPQGRFHLKHPQELRLADAMDDELMLECTRPNGSGDLVRLKMVPHRPGEAPERAKTDPQFFVRELKETYSNRGYQLVDGPSGWLPDKDWARFSRRVYHLEIANRPVREGAAGPGPQRIYLDAYLVQFNRGDCFQIWAMTDRDDHINFRNQIESIIRTVELGPSGLGLVAMPASTASGRPMPSPPSSSARPAAPAAPRLDRSP